MGYGIMGGGYGGMEALFGYPSEWAGKYTAHGMICLPALRTHLPVNETLASRGRCDLTATW
jgi:hypothetical protein